MLINNPDKFSLVIPTYEGTSLLRRTLDYLKSVHYDGHVLLCDDSSQDHRRFVAAATESYPELLLEVHTYEHGTRFLQKLAQSLERIRAEYVLLCGQDDFIIPEGVERLLVLLEERTECSAARGKVARFRMKRGKREDGTAKVAIEFSRHPMLPYEQDSPGARVIAHIGAYTSSLYSVHRRKLVTESFRRTEAATQNVIFFQYLSSCITAQQGKIACTQDLFLARQAHAKSWASSLLRDYEHWPLLVASPKFSAYYQEFRKAIITLLKPASDGAAEGLGREIDEAFTQLVKVSFCRENLQSKDEDAFQARLGQAGSPEQKTMQSVISMTSAYTDTY